jgi:hypothetical protein
MPTWEAHFPHLGNWIESSKRCPRYNCAAFAAEDESQKWDPFPPGAHYWPPRVPRSYFLSAFIEAYATIGYEPCGDGSLDSSNEKIVIYTNEYGGVEHVARQLADGKWTSKIGDQEDIIHENPDSLRVGYGEPRCFLQRSRTRSERCWINKIICNVIQKFSRKRRNTKLSLVLLLPMMDLAPATRTPITERISTLS